MATFKFAVVILAISTLVGCDMCTAGDMKCEGNTAQICNENKNWETWQNCSTFEARCYTTPQRCGASDVACCA